MVKRCPAGLICIENLTITFIVIVTASVLLFLNLSKKENNNIHERVTIKNYAGADIGLHSNSHPSLHSSLHSRSHSRPQFSYTNIPNDILLNPYEAPLRDDRYFNGHRNLYSGTRGIPINVPTQSFDTTYRQIGILTRLNGKQEMILPLMGRPLFSNKDKWNFYTMSDNNNMVKLPISYKGKSATNEYGVDNIYNGDNVIVEGYNDAFKATIYDNQVQRYLPFL